MTEHIRGLSDATAPRRPFDLIYCEYHAHKLDALRRESYFKTSPGKKALKLMLRHGLGLQRQQADEVPAADRSGGYRRPPGSTAFCEARSRCRFSSAR